MEGGPGGVLKDGKGGDIPALPWESWGFCHLEHHQTGPDGHFRGTFQPCLMTEGRCFPAEGAGTDFRTVKTLMKHIMC